MTVTAPQKGGQELRLRVSGMNCAGCAAAVQNAIESTPGVRSAAVSFTDGLATVEGEDLQPHPLIEAVRTRGFDAEALSGDAAAPAEMCSEIELRQALRERQWRRRCRSSTRNAWVALVPNEVKGARWII